MNTIIRKGSQLTVLGDLAEASDVALRGHCAHLIVEETDLIVVDLSAVTRISSRCLGTFVTLWIDVCQLGKRMKVIPSDSVQKTLDLCGLTDVFTSVGLPDSGQPRLGEIASPNSL